MCKVNNVLLIDDEQATNFYNTYVIEEMRFAKNIAKKNIPIEMRIVLVPI
jgi:D-serine dehydratase